MENELMRVSYEDVSRQLVIEDKRVGKVWKQAPFPAHFALKQISTVEGSVEFSFTQPMDMTLTVTLEDAELMYTIRSQADNPMEDLAFPPAILTPDREHYVVQTDSDGLLLPVDDCGYPLEQHPVFRCSGGPCMAWIGMTDHALRTGYMMIVETPYDADVSLKKEEGLIDFGVVWKASLGKFAYDRRIRLVFFHEGGYVAQCKYYRPYGWKTYEVRSLKEKVEQYPAAEKLLGAVHVYPWDDARQPEFLEEMKECGIDRAIVIWNSNHLPYPNDEFVPTAKRLGYAIGQYELLTDTHKDSPERMARMKEVPLVLSYYPGLYDEITLMDKDGGKYINQFGTIVCPVAVRPSMRDRTQKIMSRYPNEMFFVDVYAANGSFECYDPRHPLTREGYINAMMENLQYLQDTYNTYVGSEFGAEYALKHCLLMQGMTTLQRTWWEDSATTTPGSIYYIGDWRNGRRPSIMLGNRTATPTYHKYGINEYTRVPLYELVYHDAAIATWRWEDGNHHYPEIWWKKDLFNVLYGSAPIWCFDQEVFHRCKTTFRESYQNIMPWIGSICTDEMLNHRFITEDHKVQRTDFSSGRSVVVNFADTDYIYEGQTVPARGYLTLEGQNV